MKIAVCISGGIDSYYALKWAKEKFTNIEAVFLNFLNDKNQIKTVQQISEKEKIPLKIFQVSDLFKKKIIDYFLNEYKNGRTPNPCIFCNAFFKFEFVLNNGYDKVITGHYAKIEKGFIVKGEDLKKEQSYFLSRVKKELLKNIILPLGDKTKEDIKKSMKNFSKKESQEVCFIPDNNYKKFLIENGIVIPKTGKILNSKGRTIGFHKGYYNFTIGQRKGLNIAMGEPYYVLKIEPEKNIVYAGPKSETINKKFSISHQLWYDNPEKYNNLKVKVRYRSKEKACKLNRDLNEVSMIEEESSITPGQIAVFYSKNIVIGSGIIESAE